MLPRAIWQQLSSQGTIGRAFPLLRESAFGAVPGTAQVLCVPTLALCQKGEFCNCLKQAWAPELVWFLSVINGSQAPLQSSLCEQDQVVQPREELERENPAVSLRPKAADLWWHLY